MSHPKKVKTKKYGRGISFAIGISLFSFAAFTIFNVVTVQVEIAQKTIELDAAKQAYEQQKTHNAELEQLLQSGQDEEYIIRMAREKLNLVFPDERVYYDISGS